jgi:transglutaminase-like putative cysteine protease
LALLGAGAAVVLLWPKRPATPSGLPVAGPEPAAWEGARLRAILHLGRRVGRLEEQVAVAGGERTLRQRTLLQVQRAARRGTVERVLSATVSESGDLRRAELNARGLVSRAEIEESAVRLAIEVEGKRFEHRLEAPGAVHVEASLFPWLARGGLTSGRRARLSLLDLEQGTLRPIEVQVAERERWHGISSARISMREAHGIEWSVTVDEKGAVLESESIVPGVGTRAWAPGDDDRPLFAVDMGTWGRVLTSGTVRDPARVRRLRLRLAGLPPKMGIPTEQMLTVRPLSGARVFAWKQAPAPATPFIESDAPEVVALAREILPAGADLEGSARRVSEWIRKNIRQGDAIGPPSALFTLRTQRGNCNEITALSAALLRAAGFEVRVAVGVAHQQGAFRYHAWPEVHAGGEWLGFDPTLGQIPMDATHLRLAAGGIEAQSAILQAAGRLTLEIALVEESAS